MAEAPIMDRAITRGADEAEGGAETAMGVPIAIVGLLALVGGLAESVVSIGHGLPQIFVVSAIACIEVVLLMGLVGILGSIFLGITNVAALRLVAYLGWAVTFVVLLLMFLMPGWSYTFPFAHAILVERFAQGIPLVIGAIVIKYVALTSAFLMLAVCLWGQSSPIRHLTMGAVERAAKALWFPAQVALCVLSASRVRWSRRHFREAGPDVGAQERDAVKVSYRAFTYELLPLRRRRLLSAVAASLILLCVGWCGFSNPDSLKMIGAAVFHRPEVERSLVRMKQPWAWPVTLTVEAGGTYAVYEGSKCVLKGSGASSAGSTERLQFDWDCDGPGVADSGRGRDNAPERSS